MPPVALTLCAARFWQGWLPALFNETVVPLTGLGAPLPSFPFFDLDHGLPSQWLMRQFVMVLVARFRMSVAEIVMAYTLVSPHAIEPHRHSQPTPAQPVCPSPKHQPPRNNQADQMLRRYPSLIRCYSVRPIFLGSCVLAVKVSRDADHPRYLSSLHSCVQDVFNLLDVTLLSRIEHQLLEVLSSQPAPIAPQPARPRISLPHSLCAPMRCRCWTGGCPWTPGNIKSTPTRSSARQRTRSSRRPCRTRARRGKLDGPLYRSVGRRVRAVRVRPCGGRPVSLGAVSGVFFYWGA